MTAIVAEKVTVRKAKKAVLQDVSFAIQPGTVTGLIGPSGSGKTTLMRSIVGVQKIHGGTLEVFGQPAGSKMLRSKLGYVTQSPAIYLDLTVRQNLAYFAVLARASNKQIDEILAVVRLTDQKNQLAQTLSGGQQARVSLAIALLGDPDLLVLDEPTVGLDPLLREELWSLFADLAAKGKTLLISSHVMDEAERCNQLLLLREGRLLWSDSREALLKKTATSSVGDAFLKMVKGGEKS